MHISKATIAAYRLGKNIRQRSGLYKRGRAGWGCHKTEDKKSHTRYILASKGTWYLHILVDLYCI